MMPACFSRRGFPGSARESGNVLILALLVMTLLVALASAQFAVVQKNIRSSSFFLSHSDLHKYAESGVQMALHDLTYNVSGQQGKIGTSAWIPGSNDVGRDGCAGTYDEGEKDGIPTVGEPNLFPVPLGSSDSGIGLLVYAGPTTFSPDILRVAASASSPDGSVTVDAYVKRTLATLPKVAAVFVDPEVALDLKGNSFKIDGNDKNPDGTPGPSPAVPGIATLVGTPPGANTAVLLAQIPAKNYNQILGAGACPSLGESNGCSIDEIFNSFLPQAKYKIAPGTYTDPELGSYSKNDMRVTYAKGDVHFSGTGEGAGVLLVDGSVDISGQFSFYGLMVVRGDIKLTGGGAGVHTWGSVMVGQSLTAIDPDTLSVTGTADLFYSSVVIMKVENLLVPTYSVVYYDER